MSGQKHHNISAQRAYLPGELIGQIASWTDGKTYRNLRKTGKVDTAWVADLPETQGFNWADYASHPSFNRHFEVVGTMIHMLLDDDTFENRRVFYDAMQSIAKRAKEGRGNEAYVEAVIQGLDSYFIEQPRISSAPPAEPKPSLTPKR